MKRAALLAALTVILVLLVLFVSAPGSWAWPRAYHVTEIATTSLVGTPVVCGDLVAWNAAGGTDGGSDHEIFTWTPSGGTVQITENDVDDLGPQVSGDRLAWNVPGAGVFTWTPDGGVVQFAEVGSLGHFSGDRMVWVEGGRAPGTSGRYLYTYTPIGGTVRLADYVWHSCISGDRVVWSGGSTEGSLVAIFTWTPAGGVVQVIEKGCEPTTPPRVSGDRATWLGKGGTEAGSDYEVFTWTPAGGIVQITQNGSRNRAPQVSGDRVAWSGEGGTDGGTDHEIFTWTPAGDIVQITENVGDDTGVQVSGDRIAWSTDLAGKIFTWTPAEGVVQLTGLRFFGEHAMVSGDRIVWRGSGGKIFTATPWPEGPSFPDVPASHPYHDAIAGMAARAIIGGYEGGRFGPDDLVMRQQFAKMIVGALGLAVVEEDWQDAARPFVDLGSDDPAKLYPHEYVAVCARHNITKGTKDPTMFAPYDNISRAQVITMVVRGADILRVGMFRPPPTDWSGVLPTADPAHGTNIAKAEYGGLLAGIQGPGGTLAGWDVLGKATRGEVAQILWNLLGLND